jgi:hypothetical protein
MADTRLRARRTAGGFFTAAAVRRVAGDVAVRRYPPLGVRVQIGDCIGDRKHPIPLIQADHLTN